MTKKSSNLRKVAKIGVACLAVCVMFSACGKESSDKKITAFSFASPQATGVIDEKAKTIIVEVPSGTNVTTLVPTIAVSEKATVSPASGVAQNFTDPVIYTVTAEDGSTADYTVTVKIGSGGGGLFAGAKFNLPENVSIKFESSMSGDVQFSRHFVRIGNDFYRESDMPGLGKGAVYFKYNGTNWVRWEKVYTPEYLAHDWQSGNTFNATQVAAEIAKGEVLNFMTSEANYVAINGKTKSGTEKVAGITCDKYVITEYGSTMTYWQDPTTKLFFKVQGSTMVYEVTEWKTNVTSFAGAGVTDLP